MRLSQTYGGGPPFRPIASLPGESPKPHVMMLPPLAFAFVALGVALSAGGDAAALSLKADYAVSIRGFPVGRAELRAEIADRRYSIAFSGGISGVARLFSDARTRAEASGVIDDDRPRAESYSHVWTEDDERETVSMRFAGSGVAEIDLQPPLRRPERYVPMTAGDRADAVDLVSAFLWPAASGAAPEICDRTIPLIDGRRRFDIEAAFARMESFSTHSGSRHRRTVVCSLHYRPISGHRIDKERDGFLSDGADMEVWLAAAGDALALPVKVEFTSRLGRVVMRAVELEAD